MKKLVTTVFTFAALAFLALGIAPTASAQITLTGNPGQDCHQVVEPIFQSIGVPIAHPTCVTLLAGAGTNGDVGVCKYARDIGAISGSDYGKCVGQTLDVGQLFGDLLTFLESHGATCAQLLALELVAELYVITNFGPTGLSFAVFAFLAAGWILFRRYRGKARSVVSAC